MSGKSRIDRYILNSAGEPVAEPDLLIWSKAFGSQDRTVKQEHLGNLFISTVFLGLDHNFGLGPPILWETMVFTKDRKGIEQDRCGGSREQAIAMHEAMVERMKAIFALKES